MLLLIISLSAVFHLFHPNELTANAAIQFIESPVIQFIKKPAKLQFYARDIQDSAEVLFSGTVSTAGYDSLTIVTLKNNSSWKRASFKLTYSGTTAPFSAAVKIHSELSEFSFIISLKAGIVSDSAAFFDSVVCGDAYLINGQSNSHYTDPLATYRNEFCRSFGKNTNYDPYNPADTLWGLARGDDAVNFHTGTWGIKLQQLIKENYGIPVCIINGGSGGSSIEYNLRNNGNPAGVNTTYGRLLYRSIKAGVKDNIKAMMWYQGESNTTSTWTSYFVNFQTLYNSWKSDFTNIHKIYVFQIRMGCIAPAYQYQQELREVQRTLTGSFSDVELISTCGVQGHDGCHYSLNGYFESANNIYNLIARDFYGSTDTMNIEPPNIKNAYYTNSQKNKIQIVFGGSCTLIYPNDTLGSSLKDYFYLDGVSGLVSSASVSSDTLTLNLSVSGSAGYITYLPNIYYNNTNILYQGPWLKNIKGVCALSFYRFPVSTLVGITEPPGTIEYFNLSQNYPNPFNPATRIEFDIPHESNVQIKIFDISGKEVKQIINDKLKAGKYLTEWNASEFSSGIYFCRLLSGSFIQTKKMMLIK